MTSTIEKLSPLHPVASFDCGEGALNKFLSGFAYSNQQANASKTYVGLHNGDIVGFYTLVSGAVAYDEAPDRVIKGLSRHPVPIIILARIATAKTSQGKGVGASLLKDAMKRAASAADIVGARALVAHAKNDSARSFYERFDFISSPTNPLHLFLLMKDLQRFIK